MRTLEINFSRNHLKGESDLKKKKAKDLIQEAQVCVNLLSSFQHTHMHTHAHTHAHTRTHTQAHKSTQTHTVCVHVKRYRLQSPTVI